MARTTEIDYITTQQAADVLGVDRTTVWRFVRDGKLVKYGNPGNTRIVRYRRDEVERLLVALNTLAPVNPTPPATRGKGGRRTVTRKGVANGAS